MALTAALSFSSSSVSAGTPVEATVTVANSGASAVSVEEIRYTANGLLRVAGELNGVRVPVPASGSVTFTQTITPYTESTGVTVTAYCEDGSRASDSQTLTVI